MAKDRLPHRLVEILRIPRVGRLLASRDIGDAYSTMSFLTRLDAVVIRADGGREERSLGSGLVTNAGVALMAADWTNATATLKAMNYHDSGTGTTAAAVGDTTLTVQAGPTTRATGTQSNLSNVYKTVGTINYTSALAITEWGLFNQAAQGGTLWDHKVFSAINVANGDSIQFTYSLTVNAGG